MQLNQRKKTLENHKSLGRLRTKLREVTNERKVENDNLKVRSD